MKAKGTKRGHDGNSKLDLGREGFSIGRSCLENKSCDTTGILPHVGTKIMKRTPTSLDNVGKNSPQPERAMHGFNQESNGISVIQGALNNSIQTNTKQIFSQLGPSDPLSTSVASRELSNGACTNYGDALFQNCLDPKLMNDAVQNFQLPSCEKTLVSMNQNRMINNSQINFATNEVKAANEEPSTKAVLNAYSTLHPQGNENQGESIKKLGFHNGESNPLNNCPESSTTESHSSLPIHQNEQFAPLISYLTVKQYGNVAIPSGNSESPEDMHRPTTFTQAKTSNLGIPRGMLLNPEQSLDKQLLNFGINPGVAECRPDELTHTREVTSILNPTSSPDYNHNYHQQNMTLVQQSDLFSKLQENFSLAAEPISSTLQNRAESASLPLSRENIPTNSEMCFNPLIKAQHHHLTPVSIAGGNGSNANASSNCHNRRGPIDLYMRCDDDILSAHQILIRKQIEYFEAGAQEVQSVAHGRKKEIRMGQVGLRCKHCAVLPIKRRPRGAVYYPTSLRALYQAAQNMAVGHFVRSCDLIDQEVKQQLKTFKESKASAGHGGKKYWADSAKALDIVETERGLRFNS